MRHFLIKVSKMVLSFLFLVVLVVGVTVGYEFLRVVFAPVYDATTMSLNYEIIGSGEKNLILIHGLGGSKNYWKKGLGNITRTHKLLLVDLLGFGDSPKPKSDYSVSVQIAALEKIILKEGFDKGNTVIVGHSLGAVLSLALFAKHPDWFKGAAVIGLPIFTSKAEFRKEMSTHSRFDQLAVGSYAEIVCMLRPLYMLNWFKPKNVPDDVFSDAKKHTWQSYYYSLNEVILNTDLYAIADRIKDKNILFIQGEKDKTAPLANAKRFAKTFSASKFVEVKDGDHQLFLKNPDTVWNLINQYF